MRETYTQRWFPRIANSLISQRLASWSNSTMPSPKPEAQRPSPVQSALSKEGPATTAPVDLSSTTKALPPAVFTSWM